VPPPRMTREAMQSYDIEHYRKHGYFSESGITSGHFKVFRDVAQETNTIILVRKCNRAALRWIELGYPPKPISVSLAKTSRRTGKVTCDGSNAPKPEQCRQVHQAGHYTLVLKEKASSAYRPVNPLASRQELPKEFAIESAEMNEEGQVIDAETALPMTADYDLMGVVDAATLQRPRASGADGKRRQVVFDRTNPLASMIIAKLNCRFGRRRITHGPHDLRYRVDENNEAGCAVFYPDRRLYHLPSVSDLKEFYDRGLYERAFLAPAARTA
jgi:hypothetical protein